MKNIGIVTFENELSGNTLRGVFTSAMYMKDNLEDYGFNVDMIVVGGNSVKYPSDWEIAHHCKNPYDYSLLRGKYDFILYQTPGRSIEKYDEKNPDKYIDYLDAINTPFAIEYHSEEYFDHQPYRLNFVRHKDCKFLIFVADGFDKIYTEDLSIVPDYLTVTMVPRMNTLQHILDKAKSKKYDSIISTSAWTTFKKTLEYFQLSKKLSDAGIMQSTAGAPASTFYTMNICDLLEYVELDVDENKEVDEESKGKLRDFSSIMRLLKQDCPIKITEPKYINGAVLHTKDKTCIYDYGRYYPSELPNILENIKYHWDVSFYKVKNRKYCPRLQVVTLEAFNEGCLPVVCLETSPDWLDMDSAIRISKDNLDSVVDAIKGLSQEDVERRITSLYNLIDSYIYRDMYGKLYNKIEELTGGIRYE